MGLYFYDYDALQPKITPAVQCSVMLYFGSYIEIPHKISKKKSDKLGSTLLKWAHTLRRGESTEYYIWW